MSVCQTWLHAVIGGISARRLGAIAARRTAAQPFLLHESRNPDFAHRLALFAEFDGQARIAKALAGGVEGGPQFGPQGGVALLADAAPATGPGVIAAAGHRHDLAQQRGGIIVLHGLD